MELNTNKRYIIGIDPSSGSKSALGLALYDSLENRVIETAAIHPDRDRKQPTYHRIKSLAINATGIINEWADAYDCKVHIEWTIMQGLGGQTLQRAIGAIMALIPFHVPIFEVHNIGTKKNLTGRAKSDKYEMASALLERLHIDNYEHVQILIKESRWDECDAIAIALNNNYR